jgi:twitching motility protein PilT
VAAGPVDVPPGDGEPPRSRTGLPLESLPLAALDDGWLARSGFAECRRGLVLVAGPARSGRSTTVAAFLSHILAHDRLRVMTIERQIEHRLASGLGRVSQHEVGRDFPSQAAGLAAIAQSDANVVYAGAIDDWSAFDAVLSLAARDRLVVATLDAPTTGYALGRLFGLCPPERLAGVRADVAERLAWLLCQRLVPRVSGEGLVLAAECVRGLARLRNLIRRGALEELYAAMQTGAEKHGSITLDARLASLCLGGHITVDTALGASVRQAELREMIRRGAGLVYDRRRRSLRPLPRHR